MSEQSGLERQPTLSEAGSIHHGEDAHTHTRARTRTATWALLVHINCSITASARPPDADILGAIATRPDAGDLNSPW